MKQRYKITRVINSMGDSYPNNFKCWVYITDLKTDKKYRRRGYGKFIGNFSPIWITINKVTKQLTEWERETF